MVYEDKFYITIFIDGVPACMISPVGELIYVFPRTFWLPKTESTKVILASGFAYLKHF